MKTKPTTLPASPASTSQNREIQHSSAPQPPPGADPLPLAKYNPKEISANAPASWGQVKYWANIAGKFAQASLAAQVMAGFTLAELRKQFTHGGDRKSESRPNDSDLISTFAETCRKNVGISYDTARNWIAMSDGIKSRWKKLAPQDRIRELMRVPVSDWTETDNKLVCDALAKVTDGQTQLDFMRELGLAKKIPRSTGREPGCDGTKKKLSLSEEAELRKADARDSWSATDKMHRSYQDKFLVLTDEEVTAQIATLEQALNARKAWLKQPVNKRDPKAIAEMFESRESRKETPETQNFYAYKNKWGSILVHPQDVKDCLEAMKSPSVVGVIRFLDAQTLEEANGVAKAMFAKGEFQETFGAKQAGAKQAPEAAGLVVVAHKPHVLPDGNTITVTGFNHTARKADGKEPFTVVFNDNTAKRRERKFADQAAAETKLGISIRF